MTALEPRDRMIVAAAAVMRERGVDGTSFSEVIARSGAPRGSIYHHFPGGKTELIEAATIYAGEYLAAGLVASLQTRDPRAAMRSFSAHWVDVLRRSDFGAGCPVLAAGLDAAPAVRDAAGRAFASWETVLADAIAALTGDHERAACTATLAIAAIEGAVILARAQRSTGPIERVAAELERLVPASGA